ncbi:acyl-CoA N-acyltransferase [Phaeosphaeriaceae sp. PMI808]|nr:acyl-CoA N-acyltransferase [Phaeosphaeriaceae sp. PMI808]
MAILVRELSDDDFPRACEVESAAFKDDPLGPILFPGPHAPDGREHKIAQLKETRKSDPSVRYMQAYDEETGQLIALSKWNIYDTPELAAAGRPPRDFGPGSNPAACKAFFGGLSKKKSETIGNKPHMFLHILTTDPAFQRRGAGGLLLKWGTKIADELGIPIYLESSGPGHLLYLNHGFNDVDTFTLDGTPFGQEGVVLTFPLMIREPVSG